MRVAIEHEVDMGVPIQHDVDMRAPIEHEVDMRVPIQQKQHQQEHGPSVAQFATATAAVVDLRVSQVHQVSNTHAGRQ
jgi:hypothetical protein